MTHRAHPANRRLKLQRLTKRKCERCGSVAEAPANVIPLRCPVCGGAMRAEQDERAGTWAAEHEA